jgi:thioredoxin reductase
MSETLIVGDGPAGLSAGLLLAKKGEDARIFGKNTTKMHSAYLYNYPGVRQLDGREFIETARDQCAYFGAELHDAEITAVGRDGDGFEVTTDAGDTHAGDYLVLATGHFSRLLPDDIGVETDDADRIEIDDHSRTNVDGVYAAGVATRIHKIGASVSTGQGASAALDIIDREQDGVAHDFDTRAPSNFDQTASPYW